MRPAGRPAVRAGGRRHLYQAGWADDQGYDTGYAHRSEYARSAYEATSVFAAGSWAEPGGVGTAAATALRGVARASGRRRPRGGRRRGPAGSDDGRQVRARELGDIRRHGAPDRQPGRYPDLPAGEPLVRSQLGDDRSAGEQRDVLPPRTAGTALDLTVTPGLEADLVKSWLATNPGGVDLGLGDVAGTVNGEVYYGLQPTKRTWWAGAVFRPSAALEQESSTAAGQIKLAQFKGWMYMFSWKNGGGPTWTLLGGVPTGSCPNLLVRDDVLTAWHLCGL